MVENIPGSDLPDVREYLYIDRPRVRSLLAQINDGSPETEVQGKDRVRRIKLALQALSIEGGNSQSTSYESILEDLHVSMLERDAEALDLLTDVTDEATKPEFWKRGSARQKVAPGRLLRVTAPTQIFDPQSVISGFAKLDNELTEDSSDKQIGEMTSLLSALYGKHVLINIYPRAEKEKSFRGQIDQADRSELLDRSSLIARFGSQPQTLTSIVSVSRILQDKSEAASMDTLSQKIPKLLTNSQREKIDRVEFDDFISMLVETLEATGLQAAPGFPAVSIVPLAIYRQLERSAPFDDGDFQN